MAYYCGMTRTERLDLLLRLLADRPGITAAALAADLRCSLRSVFRDLALLRDRGYPVEASRGPAGGLRLPLNWGLGKVPLSAEEALAALLSLAIAERLNLPILAAAVGAARRKIVDAFPSSMRRRLGPLRDRLLVGPPASRNVRESYRAPDPVPARRLQAAFLGERVVSVEYVKGSGELITRRVEPHAILLNWPAWYLLGYDLDRQGARTFRLDRFVSIQEEAVPFRPRPREIAAQAGGLESASHQRWSL